MATIGADSIKAVVTGEEHTLGTALQALATTAEATTRDQLSPRPPAAVIIETIIMESINKEVIKTVAATSNPASTTTTTAGKAALGAVAMTMQWA